MNKNRMRVLGGFVAALALAASAQEQTAAPSAKPRPAEVAPLSAKSLLLGVAAAGKTLVAVGDRGNILLSEDGAAWKQVPVPVNATLTTVAFADENHGWVGGHDSVLLHTSDGGRSWALQNFKPELNKPVLSLLVLDRERAFAAGAYGLLLSTTDGGKTWTDVEAPPILEEGLHLNALIRLGNGELFLAGEMGLIGISPDGTAWERLTPPYEGSLFGALPRGEKGALVFGLRGNVFISDDVRAGNWTKVETGTFQSLFGGAMLPSGEALLVGADGESLLIDATGKARKAALAALGSVTMSSVQPWNGKLVVVGESGVSVLSP
jgi:photosystem II stability/assembly factor-like uncharacterized protein